MTLSTEAAPLRTLAVRFVGSGSEYFRIWIVNLALSLVTLGLYLPFARARKLRYLYGCTEVDGHAMSFDGNPWVMFRGHVLVWLLALAYAGAQQVSPLAAGVALLVLVAIGPALWCSSLRFRMAHTRWRGLRFGFAGSVGGAYAAAAPAYVVVALMVGIGMLSPDSPAADPKAKAAESVMMAVLGLTALLFPLLLPWILHRAKRYQHGHYAWAGERTRFSAGLGSFYGLALRVGGLSFLVVGALALCIGLLTTLMAGLGGRQGQVGPGIVIFGVLMGLLVLVVQMALKGYVTARLQNLVWNHTASQNLQVRSALPARAMMSLQARNALMLVGTVGLYLPFATIAVARLRLQATAVDAHVDIDQLAGDAAAQSREGAGDAAADVLGVDIGL